ncbi:hypothetical protein QIS74_08639 [Colletotrichum tabaci]|uniref:Uncharacterized protein n=1 Tax=Colletotrichum tabaci TaxID=1209068 RepID=A0AAV9TA79_9PEZI
MKTRLVLQKSDLGILKTVAKDGRAYGLLEGVSISFLNANGLSLLEYDCAAPLDSLGRSASPWHQLPVCEVRVKPGARVDVNGDEYNNDSNDDHDNDEDSVLITSMYVYVL